MALKLARNMNATRCHPDIASRTGVTSTRRVVVARSAHTDAAVPVTGYVPERKFLDGLPDDIWRYGKPEYSVVNNEYLKNKRNNWAPGSLHDVVESVVKTFEMEISHKTKPEYVQSFAPGFRYSQNGNAKIDGEELLRRGSYNVLINDSSYVAHNFDFDESHIQFKSAFPAGFAWEVMEVLSGPPTITMKWRHWGQFTGTYAGFKHTNETIEVFGIAIAKVNDKLQIEDLEIYYDPTDFLTSLSKGGKIDGAEVTASMGKCPFAFLGNMFGSKPHN